MEVLANRSGSNKTEIIEKAIYAYALTTKQDKNSLLRFAGSWNKEEASKMLSHINASNIDER